MPPTVIFGDIRGLEPDDILPVLRRYDIKRLDSAAVYERGDSERRLGASGMSKDFTIDTKILTNRPSDGTLTPEAIEESSRLSLDRLKIDKVNVLYCHAPDKATPIEEQARGFDEIYRKGTFAALGLSNFMPEMVKDWLRIAKDEGYVKPTWYQGQYNLLCRTYEELLFPLFRSEGIHFAAYSPLGGGFLNGNLTPQKRTGVRFVNHAAKQMYLSYYDQPPLHAAFEKLQQLSEKTGLGTDELSLRWLMHHSQLQDSDVVILGASRVIQIERSMKLLRKGPLEGDIPGDLNALWSDKAIQDIALEWVNMG